MERIIEYFETSIKSAYKSVTFNKKQFIWFYIAIFIVLSLLGMVNISSDINDLNTEEAINDSFDSHYIFQYMNLQQKMYIEDVADYLFRDQYILDIQKVVEYGTKQNSYYRCDIYVKFVNDPVSDLNRFNHKHLNSLMELGEVNTSTTPLFDVEKTIQTSRITHIVILTVTAVFSLILLSILYNIRMNNYTLDYGLFITFGADKKKLLNTAFWEMNIITLLTFIPSMIFACIANYALSSMIGYKFVFSIFSSLKVLAIAFVINVLAVLISVIKTSAKKPISLISAQDNSNMIISPRRSSNFLKKLSTKKPIKVSAKRYVKHYSTVIFTGVLFSVLFVATIFCADLYDQKRSADKPHFHITYGNGAEYSEADREALLSIKGIKGTYKEKTSNAAVLGQHALIDKANEIKSTKTLEYNDQYLATNLLTYYYADSEIIDHLKTKEHSGDLSSILTNNKTIIISDSTYNKTTYNFKPGDKILLGKIIPKEDTTEETDTTELESQQPEPGKIEVESIENSLYGNALLAKDIAENDYIYTEYTVGAVIHNDLSNEHLNIYFNPTAYRALTNDDTAFYSVYIYTDNTLPISEQNRIHKDILKYVVNTHNTENGVLANVENLNEKMYSELESNNQFVLKLKITAYLILLMSSVIWFFSQAIFYRKRSNEFTVLQAIGFTRKEIKKYFRHDAFIESIYGLIVYTVFSVLLCLGIYKLVNSELFVYKFRYTLNIPYTALAIGAISNLIMANLTVFVSYIKYRVKTRTLIPKD